MSSKYEAFSNCRPSSFRAIAGEIKQHVVENLDTYLPAVEAKLQSNGVTVHWASTAEAANEAVRTQRRRSAVRRLFRSRSSLCPVVPVPRLPPPQRIPSPSKKLANLPPPPFPILFV